MTRLPSALIAAVALLAPAKVLADYPIVSPYEIDLGELEIEDNGAASFDHLPTRSGETTYTLELGTGPTPWWHSEIEFGFDRAPGPEQPTLLTQVVSENMFQLTQPGEYWADLGFYAEYGQSVATGPDAEADEVTFGPVIGKDIGRTTSIVNLFLTRQLGPDQSTHGLDFSYAVQTKWNLWTPLSPGVEVHGDAGVVGSSPALSKQLLLVGPVGIGVLPLSRIGLGQAGLLKYEIGWLFGATRASPNGTLKWWLELEIPF